MSRSKRTAQGTASPAPREKRKLFTAAGGGLRTGWLLAVSLLSYAAAVLATRYGLIRGFAALFEAWNINAGNAALAPGWARALYAWHGSLATLAFAAVTLALCRWLRRLWGMAEQERKGTARSGPVSALAGICLALAVAALCLLPDSLRPEWPLASPRLTWAMPLLCGISLVSAWAEESFTKRVLLDGLSPRRGAIWARIAACAVFFLTGGGLAAGIAGALNVLLLGWLGCLLYERHGLRTAVGFRWGWGAINTFLLGFGGGAASVYRLYGVSEGLMTGGDAGPASGLWTALLLAAGIAWMTAGGGKRRDRALSKN